MCIDCIGKEEILQIQAPLLVSAVMLLLVRTAAVAARLQVVTQAARLMHLPVSPQRRVL